MTLSLPLSFELTLETKFSSARSSWLEIACFFTSGCWRLEAYPSSLGLLEGFMPEPYHCLLDSAGDKIP